MQVSGHLLCMQVAVNCMAFETSRHEGLCMAEQRLLNLSAVSMTMMLVCEAARK